MSRNRKANKFGRKTGKSLKGQNPTSKKRKFNHFGSNKPANSWNDNFVDLLNEEQKKPKIIINEYMNIKTTNQEKHLIKLDIDGTSTNPDFSTLNQKLKRILQKLVKQGHKICFTTGRNYLSALPFYREVGLDTFLVTYNGAYINNPSEKAREQVVVNPMANEVIKSILNEPLIKQNLCNVMIDKIDRTTISTSDDIYYQEIFFNGNPYTKGDI